MNKLKHLFILPFLVASLFVLCHALLMVVTGRGSLAWWSVIVASGPMLGFMVYLAKADIATTRANMPVQVASASIGAVMAVVDFDLPASLYTLVVGFAGTLLYVFWFSRLGRSAGGPLEMGAQLPGFQVVGPQGETVRSEDFKGSPTIFLFYRGSWCPLCNAQVKAISDQYRKLAEMGVRTLLVSPQSQEDTRVMAERFDVPFVFGFDRDLAAARRLGIVHKYGVPPGMQGESGADTVLPTVIITDATGKIVWLDETDNYRVRPEPETFLRVLNGI